MDQEDIKSRLDALERKILILLDERKTRNTEIERLTTENQWLKKENQHKDEAITQFENNIEIDQIADRINEKTDNDNAQGIKKKIDEYIVKIDKCIAHLSL